MLELPNPNPEQRAITDALTKQIRKAMTEAGGIMSFQQFMTQALYAPGLGYYSAGAQKFGRDGDFITAPELTPLFAQCLARACQPVLAELKSPCLLEFGAGSGRLACDLLTALAQLDCLPERYVIIEVSPDCRDRQQQLLRDSCPEWFDRVEWHDHLPDTPIQAVVIANEVLDAMPVTLFDCQDTHCQEAYVHWCDDHFDWTLQPASEAMQAQVLSLKQEYFPDVAHYRSEINTWLPAWIASLSDSLEAGLVLLIDYGFARHEYYHPHRTRGTLMCHYQHRAHSNPLILPGLQDITAHVDFTHVAECAQDSGFDVSGFTSQAFFLLGNGLGDMVEGEPDLATSNAIKTLTFPSEMGDLFKVMALTKNCDSTVAGFDLADYRYRL